MPLAVTCQCGSRLEIDEKFLGKEILCPDCQRPLPTKAPATPPPLDVPTHQRASGLAVMSLTAALVGGFTIIGSLIGILLGAAALRQIARHPSKYTGVGMARAGIIVGALGAVVTLALLVFPVLCLGVDEYLRWLAYAPPRTEIPDGGKIQGNAAFRDNFSLRVQPGWRQYKSLNTQNPLQPPVTADDLIAIHIPQDAWIACQKGEIDLDDTGEARQEKALERFYNSELVTIIGRLGGKPFNGAKGEVSECKKINDIKEQEFYLDMFLGGHNRRFLIRWKVEGVRLIIVVGGAPRSRFDRVESDIRKAFDSVAFK